MPNAVLKRSNLASFETLVRKVKETFLIGRERIKQEMIQTYWQTGQYIHEHILHHEERADYGKQVIPRLSERVEMSERSLQEMLQVYRRFPQIPRGRAELNWTHLRKLASIPDKRLRDGFIKRAIEGDWTSDKLQSKMKAELRSDSGTGGVKSSGPKDYSLITRPKLGLLYTYRLVTSTATRELKIDQGFSEYKSEIDLAGRFKAGDIAESRRLKDGTYSAVKSERTKEDLFTYLAYVERVVDGDTLFVEIDQGFTNTTEQYLRLRALDSPELKRKVGVKAKEFVVSLLKAVPFIFLTSTRSDKYDRYLADVFIPGRKFLKEWEKGTAVLNQSEDLLYLNNELLKHKLAWRVKY